MKFSIIDFFNKFDQIHSLLRIWSHQLKKSLMENFSSGAVNLNLSGLFSFPNSVRTNQRLKFFYKNRMKYVIWKNVELVGICLQIYWWNYPCHDHLSATFCWKKTPNVLKTMIGQRCKRLFSTVVKNAITYEHYQTVLYSIRIQQPERRKSKEKPG